MKVRLPIDLEENVKKAFHINCLKNETNMTWIITKFVEAYNRDPEKTKKFIEWDAKNNAKNEAKD